MNIDVISTTQVLLLSAASWNEQFRSFLSDGYRKIRHRQLSEKSVKLAMQHVRVFGLWHEAKFNQGFKPRNLTNYDLHLYRKWSLDQEKVRAATWNSRHWALGILCLWIQSTHGYADLMDGIEQKAQVRASTRHRSLTDDEYHRLVHTLEQDPRRAVTAFEYQSAIRNWAAVSLMLHAGLRVEEASLVGASDITINERSGEVLVRKGKGAKQRTVPLNLVARHALAAWLELGPATETLIDLTTRSLERLVKEICTRIGMPDLTPHWLRYTFAKRLEAIGTAIEKIRDLLGHNSIETTRRYLRSSIEDLRSAVEGAM